MFGGNRRAFDWKDIAEVLRVTALARPTFWRELRRSKVKRIAKRPPATVVEGEREPGTRKLGKTETSTQ